MGVVVKRVKKVLRVSKDGRKRTRMTFKRHLGEVLDMDMLMGDHRPRRRWKRQSRCALSNAVASAFSWW